MSTRLLLAVLMLVSSLSGYCGEPNIYISPSRKGVQTSTDVALLVMPAATLGLAIAKKDWKGIGIGVAECAGTLAVSYGLKYAIHKQRPDDSDAHSFPSGHTSLLFNNASFVMRRYGWKFGVPAYAVATYVGWGRIYSKKHDIWDVAAGAAIGTTIGLLATRPFMKNVEIAPSATVDPMTGSFVSFGLGGTIMF